MECVVRKQFHRLAKRDTTQSTEFAKSLGWLGIFIQTDIENPRALYLVDFISNTFMYSASWVFVLCDGFYPSCLFWVVYLGGLGRRMGPV